MRLANLTFIGQKILLHSLLQMLNTFPNIFHLDFVSSKQHSKAYTKPVTVLRQEKNETKNKQLLSLQALWSNQHVLLWQRHCLSAAILQVKASRDARVIMAKKGRFKVLEGPFQIIAEGPGIAYMQQYHCTLLSMSLGSCCHTCHCCSHLNSHYYQGAPLQVGALGNCLAFFPGSDRPGMVAKHRANMGPHSRPLFRMVNSGKQDGLDMVLELRHTQHK